MASKVDPAKTKRELVVREPFLNYSVGQKITGDDVEKVLASEHSEHVVLVSTPSEQS